MTSSQRRYSHFLRYRQLKITQLKVIISQKRLMTAFKLELYHQKCSDFEV